MSQAKQGDKVKVHYTGKLKDGTVFDSSAERDPLEFELGAKQMIPGFENAVEGMNLEENKTVTIPSDEAYGPHREDMIVDVPREQIPEHIEPEVGKGLQIRQQDGRNLSVTIAEVTDDTVRLDGNHPLAGQDLTFDIQLVAIS